jgi:hypothetical protein
MADGSNNKAQQKQKQHKPRQKKNNKAKEGADAQ